MADKRKLQGEVSNRAMRACFFVCARLLKTPDLMQISVGICFGLIRCQMGEVYLRCQHKKQHICTEAFESVCALFCCDLMVCLSVCRSGDVRTNIQHHLWMLLQCHHTYFSLKWILVSG